MLFKKRIPEEEKSLTKEFLEAYDRYAYQRRLHIEDFYERVVHSFKNDTLLEVNSGWGYTAIEILKRGPFLNLVALVEADPVMDQARKKIYREGLVERITLVKGQNQDMPFENNSFEGVISTNAFHSWSSPSLIVREMLRVVKPGGLVLMIDLRRNADEAIAEYLVREMKKNQTPDGLYAFDTFVKAWRSSYVRKEVAKIMKAAGAHDFEITEEGPMTQTIQIRKWG